MQLRLAAIMAFLLAPSVGLLSAGEAGAVFDLTGEAVCANIGNPGGASGGDCLPFRDVMSDGFTYVSGATGTDLWFDIEVVSTVVNLVPTGVITLRFTDDAGGKFDDPGTNILLLAGMDLTHDLLVQLDSVAYSDGFGTEALADPTVINTGLPGNTAGIHWGLLGLDPVAAGEFVTLEFTFVPEPGTALLLASGLAGLAVLGRRRRLN